MTRSFPRRAAHGSLAVALALGALLVSCGDDPGPSGRRGRGGGSSSGGAKSAAAAPAAAAAASSSSADDDKFDQYEHKENVNSRDPFRAFLREFVQRAVQEDTEGAVPLTALETFDLNELRPIAIITGTPVPKAMVTDPSGLGHVIRPGTRIGRGGGKVLRISKNAIVVRHIEDEFGTIKETILKLQDDASAEQYQLNIVRHDLESEDRRKELEQSGVLEGLDIDTLLKQQETGPRGTPPPSAPRAGPAPTAPQPGSYGDP